MGRCDDHDDDDDDDDDGDGESLMDVYDGECILNG